MVCAGNAAIVWSIASCHQWWRWRISTMVLLDPGSSPCSPYHHACKTSYVQSVQPHDVVAVSPWSFLWCRKRTCKLACYLRKKGVARNDLVFLKIPFVALLADSRARFRSEHVLHSEKVEILGNFNQLSNFSARILYQYGNETSEGDFWCTSQYSSQTSSLVKPKGMCVSCLWGWGSPCSSAYCRTQVSTDVFFCEQRVEASPFKPWYTRTRPSRTIVRAACNRPWLTQ